jgi:hypothetical protein
MIIDETMKLLVEMSVKQFCEEFLYFAFQWSKTIAAIQSKPDFSM